MFPATRLQFLLSPKTVLLLTVAFTLAYFFLAHEGFYFNDDYTYAELAGKVLHGNFSFKDFNPDLPGYHRLAVFGPVALFYKIFGVNIYSTTLWPLLCTIGCLFLVYFLFRKEDKLLTILALILTGLQFHTLFLSTYLFPDNILLFFALASAGTLYAARRSGERPVLFALAFTIFNFAALLSKETIVWYLPFYIWVAVADLFRKQHRVFWAWTFVFGFLLLFSYLFFYKINFGSWFYRFTMVEATNLLMENNFVNEASRSIFPRLSYEPLLFFIGTGFFLPLAFCFHFFRGKKFSSYFNLDSGERFWFWLSAVVLLQFWFGSTSVNFYNPITLVPRMASPLIPLLCVAGASQLRDFFRKNSGALWFAVPLLLAAFYARSAMTLVYGLPGLYFAFVWIKNRTANHSFSPAPFLILLILALSLRPLHFMRKPSVSSFFEQENIMKKHFQNPELKAILFTDGWFQQSQGYYFGFKPHKNLKVMNYDSLSPEILKQNEPVFLLVNESTLTNPDLQFSTPRPGYTISEEEIFRRFPNRELVAEEGKVKLFRVLAAERR